MSQPEPGGMEFIKYVETYIRPLFVQLSEALDGLRDSRDDWEREQEHKRVEFEQRVNAKLEMIGRDAEEAKAAGQAHLNSHRLKDKEHFDRVEALQQERIKARTALWVQILILIGATIVAAINILPHLLK